MKVKRCIHCSASDLAHSWHTTPQRVAPQANTALGPKEASPFLGCSLLLQRRSRQRGTFCTDSSGGGVLWPGTWVLKACKRGPLLYPARGIDHRVLCYMFYTMLGGGKHSKQSLEQKNKKLEGFCCFKRAQGLWSLASP